jgi:CheY-like chemotaxis protein
MLPADSAVCEAPEQTVRSDVVAATEKTILVVDDDLEIRETIRDVLEEEGYRVELAANGAEALAHLRAKGEAGEPALVLLDLMMPEMNGWQFCEEQRRDPRLAKIPVLVISAASVDAKKGSIAGYAFLKKPIELARLLEAVAKHAR